ncbi:MAG: ABC transporter ATP-binding protein [Chloroflexi bacterium]|nr:ABC transporter ATP-binding protein [Chloroflexota bacterium]MBT4143140.1 ABC transporter ATP-binding protein [Chloroflexota bacterium]MBT5252023.1 ABC transporter ATP-binding protein [Chloroflexota bacterium]MBT6706431.1 ABC transporter ATP-binding protein [Chloroflexota bacterium]MBT7005025.1 ABC transporter ATP-binding protein [Chloroflexota bacterium]
MNSCWFNSPATIRCGDLLNILQDRGWAEYQSPPIPALDGVWTMTAESSAISVDNLTKHFGDFKAVEKLTFDIPQNGVVGFVGPNGAGKSTTIRMLLGLIKATSGTGSVLGHPINKPSAFTKKIGALIESPALYKGLTGADNLRLFTKLRGLNANVIDEVLNTVGLYDRRDDRVATYSLGMKQRLAIAISLLGEPELLILDEPTNGLDPAGIIEIRELLRKLGQNGKTVFVSSHLLSEIERLVEHVVLINDGRLVFSGQLDDLLLQASHIIRVRPENHEDISKLQKLLGHEDMEVEVSTDSILIDGNSTSSVEVDRIAHQSGIFLRELRIEKETLEDVFIRLTRKQVTQGDSN